MIVPETAVLPSVTTISHATLFVVRLVACPGYQTTRLTKFEQMYFALEAAVDGLGVVLVPLFLAIDDIITGSLCMPFGMLAAKQRQYFANAVHSTPTVEAFYEWLLREGRDTERSMADWWLSITSGTANPLL